MYTPYSFGTSRSRRPFGFLDLESPVGPAGVNRRQDVIKVQSLLSETGHLDLERTNGPTGWYGADLRQAIEGFQRDHGLTPDGLLNPKGSTIRSLDGLIGERLRDRPVPTPDQVDAHHEAAAAGGASLLRPEAQPPVLRQAGDVDAVGDEDHFHNGRTIDHLLSRADDGDLHRFLVGDITGSGAPGLARVHDLLSRLGARDPARAGRLGRKVYDTLPAEHRDRLFRPDHPIMPEPATPDNSNGCARPMVYRPGMVWDCDINGWRPIRPEERPGPGGHLKNAEAGHDGDSDHGRDGRIKGRPDDEDDLTKPAAPMPGTRPPEGPDDPDEDRPETPKDGEAQLAYLGPVIQGLRALAQQYGPQILRNLPPLIGAAEATRQATQGDKGQNGDAGYPATPPKLPDATDVPERPRLPDRTESPDGSQQTPIPQGSEGQPIAEPRKPPTTVSPDQSDDLNKPLILPAKKKDIQEMDQEARSRRINRKKLGDIIHAMKKEAHVEGKFDIEIRPNGDVYIKGTDEWIGNIFDDLK